MLGPKAALASVILPVAVTLAAFILSGCCTMRRSYPAPTASTLATQLKTRGASVTSLRAKAKVDQFTRQGRVKVTVYILATGEGKLRFEAVSPFDTTLVTLTADGSDFASIDHRNHVFYTGPAKACNIARVFGLALEPREVVQALVGGAPLIPHREATLRWDRCQGAEKLTLSGEGGLTQRVWLKKTSGVFLVIRSEVRDSRGKVVVLLTFERHRRRGKAWIPQTIRFQQPQRKTDVIIRYEKVDLDVEIPDEAFLLKAPEGLPERELDCE